MVQPRVGRSWSAHRILLWRKQFSALSHAAPWFRYGELGTSKPQLLLIPGALMSTDSMKAWCVRSHRGLSAEAFAGTSVEKAFKEHYTKVHYRLLRTLLATARPPPPPPLPKALHTIDIHINETIDQAGLLPNAA